MGRGGAAGFRILCFGAWAAGIAGAQGVWDQAGTAEFQFLGAFPSARAAGLAGADAASAEGLDGLGDNPAAAAKLKGRGNLAMTVRRQLAGLSSGSVAYGFADSAGQAFAISADYLNYDAVDELDEQGDATGRSLAPFAFAPAVTMAAPMGDRLRLGATLKAVQQYLGDFAESQLAWGWGMDFGLLYQPGVRNLGFGLSVVDIGRKERSQIAGGETGGSLPTTLKGGVFYYLPDLENRTRLEADLEAPWSDYPWLDLGFEQSYTDYLTFRLGGRANWAEGSYYLGRLLNRRHGEFGGGTALKLAGGFTFQFAPFALDYSVQYWNGLSWAHALTARWALGG